MNRRSNVRNFTEGSVAPQLLSFAAPLFASNLLQIVYNMVDMIIVGQKLGKIGLSAVAVGAMCLTSSPSLPWAFPARAR